MAFNYITCSAFNLKNTFASVWGQIDRQINFYHLKSCNSTTCFGYQLTYKIHLLYDLDYIFDSDWSLFEIMYLNLINIIQIISALQNFAEKKYRYRTLSYYCLMTHGECSFQIFNFFIQFSNIYPSANAAIIQLDLGFTNVVYHLDH